MVGPKKGVLLALEPAGSISGRVIGDDPENLHVQAIVERDPPQRFEVVGQTQPRSDGTYRIDGLGAEPTYVLVSDHRIPDQGGYCPKYYPGTYSHDRAVPIRVDIDRPAENVDIPLDRVAGAILAGVIKDPNGHPVAGAHVVAHSETTPFNFLQTYTDTRGGYRFTCLAKGPYLVHADGTQHNLVRKRNTVLVRGPGERTRLDFRLTQGLTLSGRFVDEKGEPWEVERGHGWATVADAPPSLGSLRTSGVFNRNRAQSVLKNGYSFSIGEGDYSRSEMIFTTTSTFVLLGVAPGHTTFMFHPKEHGYGLKHIFYNGEDIRETGLTTRAGQHLDDLVFVVGKGAEHPDVLSEAR
jgi:hypothetical protein